MDYHFTSTGEARQFGVLVSAQKTFYVDSMVLVKTDGSAYDYFGYLKNKDTLSIDTNINTCFTAGMIVKAKQIYNRSISPITYLGEILSDNGSYKIEYRKPTSQFVVVKTVGETVTEVLSNPVQYNPNAVIGLAIQQTRTELKLYVTIPRGIIIDFDDARESVFLNAYPVLKKYNIKGTTHVITNSVGTTNYMSLINLKELKRNGWTVDSHTMTHLNLSTLTEAEQKVELKGAMDWLKNYGFDYDLLATPYGGHNNTTIKVLIDIGIRMHRGYSSLGYGGNNYPLVDRYKIKSDPVSNTETSQETKDRIDSRMSNYQLMHLTFHGIDDGVDAINYSPSKFEEVIEHIALNNYPTYTFSEILKAYDENRIIGNIEEYSIESASTIVGLNKVFIGSDSLFNNQFEGVYKDLFITHDILGKKELSNIWGVKI